MFGKLKDTRIFLQLVDQSIKRTFGVVENVPIKSGRFIFPMDFIFLDIEEYQDVSLILGQLFLPTSRTVMDFEANELTLLVDSEQEMFQVYTTIKKPSHKENSWKDEEKVKEHVKCQRRKGISRTIENIKDGK